MSRFNTGNPLGSGDPRDLDDNAKNMDLAINSTGHAWADRFQRSRLTYAGMQNQFNLSQESRERRFNDFIAASGYQFAGDYGLGIEITEYNQLIRDSNGEFWRVSGQVELPYTTTGAGIPEDDALVPMGDAVLRQDLANPTKGAAMVARGVVAVDSIADLLALPEGQRKEGLRYLVKGYYAGSDVGGGEFYLTFDDPRPANGVTRFKSGNMTAHRVCSGPLYLEWAGADVTGGIDVYDSLIACLAATQESGGGTITTSPGSVLLLSTNIETAAERVTLDFAWSTLRGAGRIRFMGTLSSRLDGVHVKNAYVGADYSDETLIPRLTFCKNSSISNIVKRSSGTTALNLDFCDDSSVSNVWQIGGGPSAIGGLLLFCNNCTVTDCHIVGGDLIFGYQIKGGQDNILERCYLSGVGSLQYGFYDRGDAPYGASPTAGSYEYPFDSLDWTVPDDRRETIRTRYVGCVTKNCTLAFAAFRAQEGRGATLEDCYAIENAGGSGFSCVRTAQGAERDYSLIRCHVEGASQYGIALSSSAPSLLEGGRVESCTVDGAMYAAFRYNLAEVTSIANAAKGAAAGGGSTFRESFSFLGGAVVASVGDMVVDAPGEALAAFGFSASADCDLTMSGSIVRSYASKPFNIQSPVDLTMVGTPAVRASNVNNVADIAAWIFRVPAGERFMIEYALTGTVASSGDVAVFRKYAIVRGDSVGDVVVEAQGDTIPPVNPATIGAPIVTAVSGSGRLRLLGRPGETVEWVGNIKFSPLGL